MRADAASPPVLRVAWENRLRWSAIVVRSPPVTHDSPRQIIEFAARTVDQVRAVIGVELGYDSETLPVVDHYLSTVPADQAATVRLIAAATGAYFGEVVRRLLGGRWELEESQPLHARMILSWGLSFAPAGIVAAAILENDDIGAVGDVMGGDIDTGFQVPDVIRSHIQETLARMSPVSDSDYYSLCCRLDTLEHLQEVMLATMAQAQRKRLGKPN